MQPKKGLIDESLNQFDEATEMTSIGGSTEDYATRLLFWPCKLRI